MQHRLFGNNELSESSESSESDSGLFARSALSHRVKTNEMAAPYIECIEKHLLTIDAGEDRMKRANTIACELSGLIKTNPNMTGSVCSRILEGINMHVNSILIAELVRSHLFTIHPKKATILPTLFPLELGNLFEDTSPRFSR